MDPKIIKIVIVIVTTILLVIGNHKLLDWVKTKNKNAYGVLFLIEALFAFYIVMLEVK